MRYPWLSAEVAEAWAAAPRVLYVPGNCHRFTHPPTRIAWAKPTGMPSSLVRAVRALGGSKLTFVARLQCWDAGAMLRLAAFTGSPRAGMNRGGQGHESFD